MRELSSAEMVIIQGGVENSTLPLVMSGMAPFCFFIFAKEPFYKMIGAIALITEFIGLYAIVRADEKENLIGHPF